MPKVPRRRRTVIPMAAAVLALAACGSTPPDSATTGAHTAAKGSYVARIAGTGAFLALVSDGRRLTGYLCDGRRVSRWLTTTALEQGRVALTARDGERLGTATLASGVVRGQLELDGSVHAFHAVRARGQAGLYRATVERGGRVRADAGWVVLADGSQRGTVNTFIDPLSDLARTSAAPRLDTATGTVKFNTAGTATASKLTQPGVIDIDLDR